MNIPTQHHHLELPEGTRSKLQAYQRRVWTVKLAEGALAAVFGLVLSYLAVLILDRIWDTPAWLRASILVGGVTGLAVWFPLKWHRWVWRTRQLEQVARILRRRFPRFGDQLLGIVELVHSELEQERSEALCRAALRQVDEEMRGRDLSAAVPDPRHRHWAWAAGVPMAVALAALLIVPAAGTNALARWLLPWWQTDRYTFAQLNELPDEIVVPYGERFSVKAQLAERTAWSPRQASARYGNQDPVGAGLNEGGYTFELPPQKEPDALAVSVGDAKKTLQVKPTTRPELTSMMARVKLPDYLQQTTDLSKDVRGGSVSFVRGSRASFEATATRELSDAAMDGARQQIQDKRLITSPVQIDESTSREFTWQDHLGLSAKEPFVLSINALDDGPPTIVCNKLSRELVVLDEDVLSFQVLADDDFGVKSVGMEWQGIEDPLRNPHPAKGEKVVSAGGPLERNMDITATFSAKREGVSPQSLQVRLYTDDYLPDRERVYSPAYIFHVLSPEEHAIWLTQQLRKWFRQAQDVYEREQQLHETNKDLRALPADELEQPENRRRIETQAAAEQANGRRLSALTGAGEALIKQATRNDQFNVATLENWAGMLQTLKDIADSRMPSVADLLKDAANAPAGSAPSQPGQSQSDPAEQPSTPRVGVNRDGRSGAGDGSKPGEPSKVPSIVDVESSFNELDDTQKPQEEPPPQSGGGRLTLPNTVVQGGGLKQENENPSSPVQQKVDEAVQQQEDLLAEFAKVADELQKILNNLEGSTFVKRLKAASRRQLEVAGDLNKSRMDDFGVVKSQIDDRGQETAEKIAEREVAQSDSVYVIQEDLEAYYNRVQEGKFKTILNEMKTVQVVSQLREVAETVQDNLSGQSIAQAEFWSDTLDRWAEQLVGPG
jgi:hypothetical protein